MYALLFRLVLRRLDAEAVHVMTIRLLDLLSRLPGGPAMIARLVGRPDPRLRTTVLGLELPTPVGVAAGFDKDARTYRALAAFGFGAVEVGTVTNKPQPGNPTPRLFRLPLDRAVINRMGFNNEGAVAAAGRLSRRRSGLPVVGVNVGKNKDVSPEAAAQDYRSVTAALAGQADYLVVNVSSPNTPGLRDLQTVEALRPILRGVMEAAGPGGPPVLVKIAPDLADEDVDAVADLAVSLGLAGIVAANTTIRRDGLATPDGEVAGMGAGGLSGPMLADRAEELLRRLHARVGEQLTIVSVGGVETADDVWARLAAGASFVQVYTGMIYAGPMVARDLNRGLAARLDAEGIDRIADVVGSAA